ncbi:E3 ubiquitin protein ligase RGLG2-like protein [Tanacetum coccineum]
MAPTPSSAISEVMGAQIVIRKRIEVSGLLLFVSALKSFSLVFLWFMHIMLRVGGVLPRIVYMTSPVKDDNDDVVSSNVTERNRLRSTLSTVSSTELTELVPQLGRSTKGHPNNKKIFSVQDFFRYTKAEGYNLNPYAQPISITGKALAEFDEDNLIPCYGFGDATTHGQFQLLSGDRSCNGFEDVMTRYREILPQLMLAVVRLSAGSKITTMLSANDMILCGTESRLIKPRKGLFANLLKFGLWEVSYST